jgi:hypothetical protein
MAAAAARLAGGVASAAVMARSFNGTTDNISIASMMRALARRLRATNNAL